MAEFKPLTTLHRTVVNVSLLCSLKNTLKHLSDALTAQPSPLCDPQPPLCQTHTQRVYYRGMWWVSVGCLVQAVLEMLFGVKLPGGQRQFNKNASKMGFKGVVLAARMCIWVTFLLLGWVFFSFSWMSSCLPSNCSLSSQPIHVFVCRSRMEGRLPTARSWKLAMNSLT